jgi:hypothetical protein
MSLRKPIASLELQPSETAVVHAASRILAALIGAGKLTTDNAADLVRTSVRLAIDLALETDRVVESDDEAGDAPKRLGPLG